MLRQLKLWWYRVQYGDLNWEAIQVIAENEGKSIDDIIGLSRQEIDRLVAAITTTEIARRIAYKRHQNEGN